MTNDSSHWPAYKSFGKNQNQKTCDRWQWNVWKNSNLNLKLIVGCKKSFRKYFNSEDFFVY